MKKVPAHQQVIRMSHLLFIYLEEDPFDQPSMMSSLKALNNASPDNTKFFTVQGKIFLGPASPKTLKKNKVVKENIFLADTTGTITIHIREPVLNDVTDRCSYELIHNRLRKFMG